MKTITDLNVENKTVILRLDLNVPIKDGKVVDNNRIVESLETIKYLITNNAKIIIMSHLGKVKTKEDLKNTLFLVKEELEKLLKMPIKFSENLKGKELESLVSNLKPKEILLLENTRFMDYPNNLESGCDEKLSKYWAGLGDVFVLDAFGSSHRAHASTYGISKYLPHAVGFLVLKEVTELDKIKSEDKIIILGGAKVSDKIKLIKNLMSSTSLFLIGGAMCASFLKVSGVDVGSTFVEVENKEELKELLDTKKIILPVDVVTENGVKDLNHIEKAEHILDIGPKTIEMFTSKLDKSKLILLNGTMGKYEEEAYENGTKKIFDYLGRDKYKVVVCGGDTVSASNKYNFKAYFKSTGGGASLEYIEGNVLKPLEIMNEEDNKLIVLNNKSYLSYDEMLNYIDSLKGISYKNLVVLPNIAYISLFKNTNILLGAQNFYSYNYGAYTGETSLELLKDLGVTYTLVGHPERLTLQLDFYEEVKDKLFKSLSSGFNTILCLMHDGKVSTLKKELRFYLKGIDLESLEHLIISFEPADRIESGNVDLKNIEYVRNFVKSYMKKNFDKDVPFLYGGGVTLDNIKDVIKITDGVILGKNSTNIEVIKNILKVIN